VHHVLPASSPLPPEFAAAYNGALARAAAMRLDLRWYPSVSSTMDLAAEAVQAGAAEGVVFCADEQTAGRGRRGRAWSSPPGAGLYFSIVLRPAHDPSGDSRVLALVTLAAGVAVREAIGHATGLVAELKWPNDVVLGRRKLAGILAEGLSIGTPEQAVVLGVGLNVMRSSYPPDVEQRAISIEEELGRPADRGALLEEMLVSIGAWYDGLRRGDADDILRAWRDAAPSARGARVEWNGRSGITAGVDDTGALLIETAAGLERVIAGELRWL
jgi:BirA family transcriptional regulator, biotin operon repressor / biotin---[acetyl-CoA-carboxylase] ligase